MTDMNNQIYPPPDGNQNRTGVIIGMVIGPITIAFVFVVLRLYTRLSLTKSARWDDWTILLALVMNPISGHWI